MASNNYDFSNGNPSLPSVCMTLSMWTWETSVYTMGLLLPSIKSCINNLNKTFWDRFSFNISSCCQGGSTAKPKVSKHSIRSYTQQCGKCWKPWSAVSYRAWSKFVLQHSDNNAHPPQNTAYIGMCLPWERWKPIAQALDLVYWLPGLLSFTVA